MSGRTGRVPPHNPEAEESLIGAMLLSRDAIRVGLDLVDAADFYKPGLARIFESIDALHHWGASVDPVTLAEDLRRRDLLDGLGGKPTLMRLQAGTPASANAQHYAGIVAELAVFRRVIALAGDLSDTGYGADREAVDRVLHDAEARVVGSLGSRVLEPGREASEWAELEFVERWVIPGMVSRDDQVTLTGSEGWGKSLALAQWGVQAASGMHPFTGEEIEPLRVLHVDLENGESRIAKRMRWLTGLAGGRYRKTFWTVSRRQGVNLRHRRDARWLDRLCAHHRPDLLMIGPVSKCYHGAEGSGKYSEEAATETAAVFDEIRVRYDCGLLIEAHAPHGESGDRAGGRVRGSSYWLSWAAMGVWMRPWDRNRQPIRVNGRPGVDLVHFRGARDRDTGAAWPTRLVEGGERTWPWIVPLEELEEIA